MRKLRALDALFDERGFDFIKLDVQGYELEVLRGAQRILAGVEAVLLEVSLLKINRGAPILDEVVAFMRERQFVAYEILEIHRRPLDRAMNQVDIIFVRQDSPLLADTSHY